MSQIFTIILTIFYVAWLCAVLWFLYTIAKAVQKAADAIYAFAKQRNYLNDRTN